MKNDINVKVFSCTRCPYQWLQRPKVLRNKDGSIRDIKLNEPKNCSKCKSPSWQDPRS